MHIRLIKNQSPKLACTTISGKFTVNIRDGNVKLTYPIGLIIADELAKTGEIIWK